MFKIGNKINKENPTNVYKLVIDNISGRDDHTETTKSLIGKEFEPAIKDIIDLCNWANTFRNEPSREEIEQRYKDLQVKHKNFFDTIDPAWEPVVTYDILNPSSVQDRPICRPKFVRLTWFDENGIEYKVETK